MKEAHRDRAVDAMPILMADDDPDDQRFATEALKATDLKNELVFVSNGVELLNYLRGKGSFAGRNMPAPGVILLDLNMPKMDGHEALKQIKEDENLRQIPIVVMTTSEDEADVRRAYDLGVNSFIVKPITFKNLVSVMAEIGKYWFETVTLPPPEAN